MGMCLLATACSRSPEAARPPQRLTALPAKPRLMFVSVANDDTFHTVEVASLIRPDDGAFNTGLSCLRVYFGGATGICLTSTTDGPKTEWWAELFDAQFRSLQRFGLSGEPSRVRVSPDGRLAGATVFESGHSYAEHGFSTRTTLYDLTDRTSLGDLEQFHTSRNGEPIHGADFNFWGVTFARDSNTFYATLDTAGVSYLVKGDAHARTLDVLRPNVECPSLSPDNSRIAFKRRVGARSLGWWQIAVLNLDTMSETILNNETRSVDDQVEWLDNDRVVYHLANGTTAADLWSLRIDNSAPPVRLLSSAYSPAVIR
jgi:Tol biopolymer transport system component